MAFGTVRCVVFDLDDTLWNTTATLAAAHEAMNAALAELCPEVHAQYGDVEAFREQMLLTIEQHPARKHDFTFIRQDRMAEYMRRGRAPHDPPMETLLRLTGSESATAQVYDAWFRQRNNPKFFPGACEALRSLRDAGLKIGTLTDGNSQPMEMEALRDLVDFCVSAVEAGVSKPDPRMFALCERKAACSAAELVMVGDNAEKDVKGARGAGWRAIWVRSPTDGPGGFLSSKYDIAGGAVVSGEDLANAAVNHVGEVEAVLRKWRLRAPGADEGSEAVAEASAS